MEISSDASRLLRAKALIVQFHDSNVGTPNAHNLYAHSLLIMGSGSSHKIILQSLYQNNLFYPFLVKLGIELTRGFTCFFLWLERGTTWHIWYHLISFWSPSRMLMSQHRIISQLPNYRPIEASRTFCQISDGMSPTQIPSAGLHRGRSLTSHQYLNYNI